MATNSYDFSLDYGPSSYNQPQTFTADYVYDLPFFKGQQGFEGKILGGWQVSGITSFFSGQSFSLSQPHDPWDPNGLNVGLGISSPRPDQISTVQKTKTVGAWFSHPRLRPPLITLAAKAWQPARPRLQQLGSGGHQERNFPVSATASSSAASSSTPSTTRASRASTARLPIAALARSLRATRRVASSSVQSSTSSSLIASLS